MDDEQHRFRCEVRYDEGEQYCRDCGCERLIFLAEYANGQEYKCRDCGTEFMW